MKNPLVLGKTERTITLLLARYLFLRPDQLTAAAFGKSESHVQRALRGLIPDPTKPETTESAWLLRAQYLIGSANGKAPFYYTLNTPAWEWIGEQGLPTPYRFRPSEEVGKVSPHTEAISALGIALERFTRQSRLVDLLQFWHERVLPYSTIKLPDGSSHRLRLDAWVQLAVKRPEATKQRCLVIEVDRDSHYQTQFREKIRSLLIYRTDAYRQQFGTESIAILFTVPSSQRRKHVLTYIEAEIRAHEERIGKQVRPDLFWVTDVDPAKAGPLLFTQPCWFHPLQTDPVALFPDQAPISGGSQEYAFSSSYIGQENMLRFYQQINERPPMTSLESDLDEIVS